jgi:predicted HicB family RNase H-like nuclease
MSTMTHEGYIATLDIDEDAGVIHGRVVNARAVLTFEGTTVEELRGAFAETLADYREGCVERGVEPEKPYKGRACASACSKLTRPTPGFVAA